MITQYSKLIHCNRTVEIYDYTKANRYNKMQWISRKEKEADHSIAVRHLAATNFDNDSVLFSLEYKQNNKDTSLDTSIAKKKFSSFIENIKIKVGSFKYLCVIQLPKNTIHDSIIFHLLVDLSLHDLLVNITEDQDLDTFMKNTWKQGYVNSHSFCDYSDLDGFCQILDLEYSQTKEKLYLKSHGLNLPRVIYGSKVNEFVKVHNLADERIESINDYYDETCGWVHHIEYSIN